jgi:hypothetical protein
VICRAIHSAVGRVVTLIQISSLRSIRTITKPYSSLKPMVGTTNRFRGGNVWRVVSQKGLPSLAWRPASLDHVLGDARLSDLKLQLQQFAVDAPRTPKANSLCSFAGSARAIPPRSAVALSGDAISNANATKAGPMPPHQRVGSNNHKNRKDRRKPTIELNEGPAIVVREMSAALHLTSQDHQLMSERGIFSASSRIFDLKGERPPRTKHRSPTFSQLRRFHHVSNSDKVFGTRRQIA